jgi:hypothetical protein
MSEEQDKGSKQAKELLTAARGDCLSLFRPYRN